MKLPHIEQADIPMAKIVEYLLSVTHPGGFGKALFFRRYGFRTESWEVLAAALRRHAIDHEVRKREVARFGERFVVEGEIATPDGRRPMVRSVWFIERGEEIPRFVTAYPLPKPRPAT